MEGVYVSCLHQRSEYMTMKELINLPMTKSEREGLEKMIEMMVNLKCQIHIRQSHEGVK